MIIDTHLHLIDLSALRYPWLGGAPALNRDFPHEEYATQARRAGIEAALHMEVDVDQADIEAETSHVKALSRQAGSLLRGAIAACRPEEGGFAAYLERQHADPFIKGFRRVLHVMPDELSDSALFRDNIKGRRLAANGEWKVPPRRRGTEPFAAQLFLLEQAARAAATEPRPTFEPRGAPEE